MQLLLALFSVTALLSLSLTPVLVRLAPRLKALDAPHALGIHQSVTPRVGGLAMFAASSLVSAAALSGFVPLSTLERTQLLGLLLGGGILVAAGLFDDMRRIAPEVKFAWEVLGAVVAIIYGVQVGVVPALFIVLPLTALYLVGGANSLNLLDGMDGLAGGLAAIGALFLGAMGLVTGDILVVLICTVMLGAIVGFLPFNLHPAKTFMGDAGSLYLGFLLAAAAALLASEPYNLVRFLAPLLVIGLPLLDTAGALVRRKRGRVDMFSGDRRHIYDLLSERGVGYWRTVLLLWVASIALGLAGLTAANLEGTMGLLVLALVALVALVVGLRLGIFADGRTKSGPDSERTTVAPKPLEGDLRYPEPVGGRSHLE